MQRRALWSGSKFLSSVALKLIIFLVMGFLLSPEARATESLWHNFSNEQIANAIYLAEGGIKTKYPYGILTKYKTTTPRQACLNTIIHARKDWNKKSDFIEFLGSRYCPINCDNDNGTNKYWVKNVKHFLKKGD